MTIRVLAWAGSLLLATWAVAGPPVIENVELESRVADPSLTTVFESWSSSPGDGWLGWHVPIRPGDAWLCCWGDTDTRWRQEVCDLEGGHRHFVFSSERPVGKLDNRNLVILLHRRENRLDELRVYSDGCALRADGADLLWLEGVDIEASVALMERLAGVSVVTEEALMALSLHDTPMALERLSILARQADDSEVRGQALFWLAQTGAPDVLPVLLAALHDDPASEVREQAVFAVSQLPDGEGSPVLLRLASDRSQPSSLRQEAFFWFVQADEERALELIDQILSR